uniref:Flotillin n=1 Tax=Echeneis naucrates TaxID=173247 RepID=A0A665WG79_ECHNA
MCSELGKLTLDKVFRIRNIHPAWCVSDCSQASAKWEIRCLRYEIKDVQVPPWVKESMQLQVKADHRKRATALESEGTQETTINVAEGQKAEQINKLAKAEAKSVAIRLLSEAPAEQASHLLAPACYKS